MRPYQSEKINCNYMVKRANVCAIALTASVINEIMKKSSEVSSLKSLTALLFYKNTTKYVDVRVMSVGEGDQKA